ncbi:hypothetical protein NL533_34945, partial [Klebsiella pneumoniae]|nr:hypothetical protein [Klebsiella pneumoniae]
DSFDTTLAQNGQTQTPMLICAVGWKLQPEPFCLSAEINAWSAPADPGTTQPFSPNAFTANDLAEILGGDVNTQSFEPAVL